MSPKPEERAPRPLRGTTPTSAPGTRRGSFRAPEGCVKFPDSISGECPHGGRGARAEDIFPGAHLALGLFVRPRFGSAGFHPAELRRRLKFSLRACPSNPASPHAAHWAEFCGGLCARLAVPLQVESVGHQAPPRSGLGVRGAPIPHERCARGPQICRPRAHAITSRTLLLRLCAGRACAARRHVSSALGFPARGPRLLRPLSQCPAGDPRPMRSARPSNVVEDESNSDTIRSRNFLRHDVFSRFSKRQFPGSLATISSRGPTLPKRASCSMRWREPLERCAGVPKASTSLICRTLGDARATEPVCAICASTKNSSRSRRREPASCGAS